MERLTLHGHVSRMIVIFVVHYDCIITIGIEISMMHGYSVNYIPIQIGLSCYGGGGRGNQEFQLEYTP